MIDQYSSIRNKVLVVTFLAIICGLIIPKEWVQGQILGFALLLILGGVPHGASDYLIVSEMLKNRSQRNKNLIFWTSYLAVIVLYGLLWWLSSITAFIIFLLVSFYHFGQSNWQYVNFTKRNREIVSNLLWGMFVVLVPVLIYHEEAALIVREVTGIEFLLASWRWPIIFLLITLNLVNIIQLFDSQVLDKDQFHKEIVNILILSALFFTTPLLIGFGIYFILWHSLGSVLDQVSILKNIDTKYSLWHYILQLLPLTFLAFTGLAFLYWFLGDQMNYGANLGVLFLFISIITVPHSILIDRFYLSHADMPPKRA